MGFCRGRPRQRQQAGAVLKNRSEGSFWRPSEDPDLAALQYNRPNADPTMIARTSRSAPSQRSLVQESVATVDG